ncbi:MAG: MMPL family transporter [Streptosporangiaceae bacterium]|jgi:uncharacterized membrane protein YdfJ with MMPL/SSD domain
MVLVGGTTVGLVDELASLGATLPWMALLVGDNTASVASGLQRTGGLITSLALLLIIVVGAFSASGITLIKLMGVGMIVALLVEATVVRVLLVPAIMRLLGRANWWRRGRCAACTPGTGSRRKPRSPRRCQPASKADRRSGRPALFRPNDPSSPCLRSSHE